MGKWLVIDPVGLPDATEHTTAPTLAELYKLIGNGCNIVELVLTGKHWPREPGETERSPWQMFVDEEGLLKPNPIVNVHATEIAIMELSLHGRRLNGVIVGTAVILIGKECLVR